MKLANLKKFKKNLKKTNEEIADATGFSRNSVQRYFSGETDPPTDLRTAGMTRREYFELLNQCR